MCNASLHTKEDLSLIYKYLEEGFHIYEEITNSFHSDAESVRDKHLSNIAEFQKLFQEKPVHLKHILEDITATREKLLPSVEEISKVLNQFPELLSQLQDSEKGFSNLYNQIEKQKKICELTCDNNVFMHREMILNEDMPYDKREFYCGSIAEVREVIQSTLSMFSQNQKDILKDRLDLDDKQYTYELEQLKIKLKDIALKEFGYVMYDILELQDAYFHFSKEVKAVPIKTILENVKKNIAQIKPKMLTLELAIPKLVKYCRTCTNNFVSRQWDSSGEKTANKENLANNTNILDELIHVKLQNLEKEIEANYTSIFEDLVKTIEVANSTNIYIDDIKPIQTDVIAATQKEFEELNTLKNMMPMQHRQGLLDLEKKSKDILHKIDEQIHFIEDYIK